MNLDFHFKRTNALDASFHCRSPGRERLGGNTARRSRNQRSTDFNPLRCRLGSSRLKTFWQLLRRHGEAD